jgi:hypothetical protein
MAIESIVISGSYQWQLAKAASALAKRKAENKAARKRESVSEKHNGENGVSITMAQRIGENLVISNQK